MGQTIRGKQGNTGGMQSSQLVGGKVLVFTKGPGKRTIYAIGSEMKVKMINGLKVEGRLQAVRDTGFILGNKMITYDSLEAYYVPCRDSDAGGRGGDSAVQAGEEEDFGVEASPHGSLVVGG